MRVLHERPFHASTAGPLLDNGRPPAAVKSRYEVDLRSTVKAHHVRRGTDMAAYLSSMLAAKPLRSAATLGRRVDTPVANRTAIRHRAAPRSNERMR